MNIVVFVTAPAGRKALRLAREIVDSKLGACVRVSPEAETVYRWKGKVDTGRETLLTIKTRKSLFPKLRSFIVKRHPYEVPEIIALPITDGHAPYLRWIQEETAK